MTAKRFTMIYFETDGNLIFDETKHNGEWYNSAECLQDNEIVELLNVLHEKTQSSKEFIEQLQEELVLFKEAGANMGIDLNTQITALKQENEQLRHDATILIQSNQDYRKENEQLKEQLMDCEKFRHTVFQEMSKEMNKHD